LVIGLDSPDDAAVWRLDDEHGIAVTTDFFTPIVDDPYSYGAIAAANALSDLYAMGAEPFLALNVTAMPPQLDAAIISQIIRGGAEKVREAGAIIAGGHSIQDQEPKYGLVALGKVALKALIAKDGARPGDVLMLSKPLGTGVTTTAFIRDAVEVEYLDQAVSWMSRLNSDASVLARKFNVRAGTDITGFGLLGHANELAQASQVALRFYARAIPFFKGARNYADQGTFPAGSLDNQSYFQGSVSFDAEIDRINQMLMFDSQTSGGLLLAVPAAQAEAFLMEARGSDVPAWAVGEIIKGEGISVKFSKHPLFDQDEDPHFWFS
jgi:selenide,water dikinase